MFPSLVRLYGVLCLLLLGVYCASANAATIGAVTFATAKPGTPQTRPYPSFGLSPAGIAAGMLAFAKAGQHQLQPQTICFFQVTAEIGDPAAAPTQNPTNRIGFASKIQCDTSAARAQSDNSFGVTADQLGWQVEKQIISLQLVRQYPLGGTQVVKSANVPATTTNDFVAASGVYDMGVLDTSDVYRIKVQIRLADRSHEYGAYGNHWYSLGTPSQVDSGDCENATVFAAEVVQSGGGDPVGLVTGSGTPLEMQCTYLSPPFTLADLHTRHFLTNGSTYYKECSFNSQRAGSEKVLINGVHYGLPMGVGNVNSASFVDPAAQCLTWSGSWQTVSMAFSFERTFSDNEPCGTQSLSDTQVLSGNIRINNGPAIPAKMLLQVIPLGPFAPIVQVSIVDNFGIHSPVHSTETGVNADASYLNDEVESIGNVYSYLIPEVAPSIGSSIYTMNVRRRERPPLVDGPVDTSPIILPSANLENLCDRPEVRLDIAGTLQEPEDTDVGTHVGSGMHVRAVEDEEADRVFSAAGTTPALDASSESLQMMTSLASLTQVIGEIPRLPFLPPVPYVITAEYLNPLYGTPVAVGLPPHPRTKKLLVPAVFGVPTPVKLPVGSDVFLVTVGTTNQTASLKALAKNDSGDYMMRVQRINPTDVVRLVAGLTPVNLPQCTSKTPVNITATVGLADTLKAAAEAEDIDPALVQPLVTAASLAQQFMGAPTISIGYHSLATTQHPLAGSTVHQAGADSPKDFALVYLEHGDAGYSVHERTAYCNNPTTPPALDLTATYSDPEESTKLTLTAEMASAIGSFDFAQYNEPKEKRLVRYTGSAPLTKLSIDGTRVGSTVDIRAYGLVNAAICQQEGNLCNRGWRRHKRSRTSITFDSWDKAGNPLAPRLYYYSDANDTSVDFTASTLAIDAKLDFGTHETYVAGADAVGGIMRQYGIPGGVNFQVGAGLASLWGDFPYWAQVSTNGRSFSGSISTPNIDLSGSFAPRNREIKLKRRLVFLTHPSSGSANCGSLSMDIDSRVPGLGSLTKTWFCSGWPYPELPW